jgi:hypothetical protein
MGSVSRLYRVIYGSTGGYSAECSAAHLLICGALATKCRSLGHVCPLCLSECKNCRPVEII